MEQEISETYRFSNSDYGIDGRHKEAKMRFRDWVKTCEHDFHCVHPSEYAIFFYSNSHTMRLLQASCDANPKLIYGMDLYNGRLFHPINDPNINHKIDEKSEHITVYGIDSAFMPLNEIGIPVSDEAKSIYPLTLLIDNMMGDGEIRLSCPNNDDEEDEEEHVETLIPKLQFTI